MSLGPVSRGLGAFFGLTNNEEDPKMETPKKVEHSIEKRTTESETERNEQPKTDARVEEITQVDIASTHDAGRNRDSSSEPYSSAEAPPPPPPNSGNTLPAENPPVTKREEKKPEYATEFHRIWNEFVSDITFFPKKYPLIALISTIALASFGLMNTISFSPTSILTGLFLIALAIPLGTNVLREMGNDFLSYLGAVGSSMRNIFNAIQSRVEDLGNQIQ